jgi:hypothetical protein
MTAFPTLYHKQCLQTETSANKFHRVMKLAVMFVTRRSDVQNGI